ncbi:MAG: hypothetical protein IMY73_03055 [Bacteroidetes bacterium]|nr:hypothetical protein [Bacteroidota bacterium]
MSFAKGRSNLYTLINDEWFSFISLLCEQMDYLKKKEEEIDIENSKKAIDISEGDKEIEFSMKEQFNIQSEYREDFVDLNLKSKYFLAYSLFERHLNLIEKRCKKDLKKGSRKSRLESVFFSYGIEYYDKNIYEYIDDLRNIRNGIIHNFKEENQREKQIKILFKYKFSFSVEKIRDSSPEVVIDNGEHLKKISNKIHDVLLYLVSHIDEK